MAETWQPLGELASDVRARRVSARELVGEALARIERVDPQIHAWVALDGDRALDDAAAIDARIAAGDDVGPLAGIPLGVKDMEDAIGFRTTYGSLLHRDAPIATSDSSLVARLRRAGCVVLGKLNTPDHGYSADTTNALFGATHNPWQLGRSPGGSSGASAAALVTSMVPLATGGDSGGSIRIPAAYCGLPGFKPSNGRTPVGGPTPPSSGWLVVRSVMARTMADTAYSLASVVGHDPTDLISLPDPSPAWPAEVPAELPSRVVWAPAPGWPVDTEVARVLAAAVARLAAAGVEVVEVERIVSGIPLGDYYTIATVYQQRTHGHRRGTPEWDLVDPGIRGQIDHADANVTAAIFASAFDAIHRHAFELEQLFAERAPLLLCPTVAGQAARSGELGVVDGDPTILFAPFTQIFNMTKHPAGSVPCGFTADGMPVGLQVVGSHHDDLRVLGAMAGIESLFADVRRPPVHA